jgi:rhamnulokinase
MDSLAFRYKTVFTMLEDMTGKKLDVLHIVGGGTQARLLSQLPANALNRRIIAGPVEATATGNILAQLIATGEIDSITDGRRIVKNSFDQETFKPTDTKMFDEAYTRFHKITGA